MKITRKPDPTKLPFPFRPNKSNITLTRSPPPEIYQFGSNEKRRGEKDKYEKSSETRLFGKVLKERKEGREGKEEGGGFNPALIKYISTGGQGMPQTPRLLISKGKCLR